MCETHAGVKASRCESRCERHTSALRCDALPGLPLVPPLRSCGSRDLAEPSGPEASRPRGAALAVLPLLLSATLKALTCKASSALPLLLLLVLL